MKTILHLCADTGSDSKPWKDAGYNVILVGKNIGVERYTGSYIHKNFEAIVAKIMLQFFQDKMTDEQIFHAKGRIVNFLTKNSFTELAGRIVDDEIAKRKSLPITE